MNVIPEVARKVIVFIIRRAGYDLVRAGSVPARDRDITDEEWETYSRVKPFTMVSAARIVANIRAVDYIVGAQVDGDLVECGVWRGGSSMAMALTLLRKGDGGRKLWLYDTYSGMTNASAVDISYSGESGAASLANARGDDRAISSGYASLEEVRANMCATGYPMTQVEFVKGPVEQTLPGEAPDKIAVLRIDTDWYESTKHELIHLYPRMSAGGVLIIDDYGHWQGARKAVDEYFAGSPVFLNRIDYTGRLIIKPFERTLLS